MPYSLSVTEGSSYNLSASDTSSSLSLSLTGPAGPSGPAGPAGTGGGDHGELDGLGDDDHPQYAKVAATNNFTATQNFSQPVYLSGAVMGTVTSPIAGAYNGPGTGLTGTAQDLIVGQAFTANALTSVLPILSGGTGASSAGAAATNLGLGTGNSPTFAGLTVASGSITTSQPLSLTQTWSTTATYTGLSVNVTDSGPSNAASLLMDLQVGGASRFRVRKDGIVVFGNNASIEGNVSGKLIIRPANGVNVANCAAQGFHANSTGTIGFALTTPDGAIDTGISRKTSTPGTLMVGNGTANNASGSIELASLTASGSIESTTAAAGLVLKSPNGTRYRVTVENDGTLTRTVIT